MRRRHVYLAAALNGITIVAWMAWRGTPATGFAVVAVAVLLTLTIGDEPIQPDVQFWLFLGATAGIAAITYAAITGHEWVMVPACALTIICLRFNQRLKENHL